MTKTKKIWTILRTLGFLAVGIMNTILLRPEDVGSWKNYFGYAFLILAAVDTFFLFRQFRGERYE